MRASPSGGNAHPSESDATNAKHEMIGRSAIVGGSSEAILPAFAPSRHPSTLPCGRRSRDVTLSTLMTSRFDRRARIGAAAMLLVASTPLLSHADEGQWMPSQIAELDATELRRLGLELEPRELYDPQAGGIMDAIVNLSGCSAGFVSPRGLVATNHHCAYGAIQAQSSVEHDYLTDGFLALDPSKELEAKGRTVRVLHSITDVTDRVRAVAKAEPDPAKRAEAVEREHKTIIAECEEADPAHRCRVAEFYNGSMVSLFTEIELEDVRLVYAPPSSVGNYGGEIDNWMWPRHTGDYTLLRAYVGPDGKPAPYSPDNVPYEPKRWLETNPEGVGPDDFVAVLGFPGHTDRYLPASEVQRQLEQFLPARVDLYGAWIDILEREGAADPAVKIKVAATLRSLANRHKNARGMIEGIHAIGLLDRRKDEETHLAQWASQPDNAQYADVLTRLAELTEERREAFDRELLVTHLAHSSNALAVAIDLVRWAKERSKPDLERASGYMDRDRTKLWSQQDRRIRDFDPKVDRATMAELFGRIEALPAEARFTTVRVADLGRLLGRTRVTDHDYAKALFDAADWGSIENSRDPLIVLARELVEVIEQREATARDRTGRMLELGPAYFEMLAAVRKGPVYPDANGTLRFSYATVAGYSPRDGLFATPQTTLTGQLAKHTGTDPFDLPARVREAAAKASSTYWSDPDLGDVPVCFLSSADTTGGNSGSPVVDGRGRWIGLNFDRVWENIAGDFGYSPARSRNIIVDVRYLLWSLDQVEDAGALLEELGVADRRGAPPREARRPRASEAETEAGTEASVGRALDQEPPPQETSRAGCGCSSSPSVPLGWSVLGLSLLLATPRRKR